MRSSKLSILPVQLIESRRFCRYNLIMELLNAIITVGALVSLFLFAVSKFTKQVEQLEGKWLEKTLRTFAGSPTRGIIFGALTTAIIQSSTATIVATQSLVNAGFLSFASSVGIVLGANIGTTITSQLIAFNITHIASYIVVIGFLLSHVKNRFQVYAKMIYYFGLMFLSLSLISVYLSPLEYSPAVANFVSHISSLPFALLAGLLATALFQSSSVVTGIVLVLTGHGVLALIPAVGIVLGSNVGTTVTALLASTVMNREAKRTAVAHALFNLIGVIVVLAFFSPFMGLVQVLGGGAMRMVANAHLLFNLISVLVFLPFLKPFASFVARLVR